MRLSVRRGSQAHQALIFLLALILAGVALAAQASPPSRAAYVVGQNDGSIVRIDLESGAVQSGFGPVGTLVNRVDVDAEAGVFVAVNSGSDDVSVFDLVTESVVAVLPLPPGSNPWAAEIVGDEIFVSALLQDVVHVLHLPTGTLLATIPVGTAPEGMCLAGGKLWVANTGFDFGTFEYGAGSVSCLDPDTHTVLDTVPVSLNPQECLALPDGTVHVVCTGDFFLTEGAIDVIDPGTGSVIDSFPVSGYPGGGDVHEANAVFLNVTTTSFGAEIHGYDPATHMWIFDGTNPLLPSLDFYGNLRAATIDPRILVPNFAQDLLLMEDPLAPGTPQAWLVGDGPIDVAVVERDSPVPLLVSGLTAVPVAGGVRLSWRAMIDGDLTGFAVERRQGSGPWRRLTDLPPARETSWVDGTVEPDLAYSWRVGAIGWSGDVTWMAPLALTIRADGARRLAIRRVYPNPSREDVALDLGVPRAGELHVEILDVAGRRVARIDAGEVAAGAHRVLWDGRDEAGRAVAPGMYFARAGAGRESVVGRILRFR